MTSAVPPCTWSNVLEQWKQIGKMKTDFFPKNYGAGENFVLGPRNNLAPPLVVPNCIDMRVKNLVLHNSCVISPRDPLPNQHKTRIYCDWLVIHKGHVRFQSLEVYARFLIQMSAKEFKKARNELSMMPKLDRHPILPSRKWCYFPPGTVLSSEMNSTFFNGQTGLMLAAGIGNRALVRLLLTANANLEAMDNGGWRALQYAINEGHQPIVDLLLSNAKVNTTDRQGNSPLFLAAEKDLPEIAKSLRIAGANVKHINHEDQTLLDIILENGSTKVFRFWKEFGIDIESYEPIFPNEMPLPLMDAIIRDDIEKIDKYLKDGGSLKVATQTGDTPLILAAKHNCLKTVEFLIDKIDQSDIDAKNKNGQTALKWAAKNGSEEIVRILLKANAYFKTSDVNDAFALSVKRGTPTVKALFFEILTSNDKLYKIHNLFEKAIQSNEVLLAEQLHQFHKAEFKGPRFGFQELFNAADCRQDEMVAFLIHAQANIQAALLHAVAYGNIYVTGIFIANSPNAINMTDDQGRSLVAHAISRKHTDLTYELLKAGASIHTKDFRGMTPFMHSLRRRNEEIAERLLEDGANFWEKDYEGCTPLMYATQYKLEFMVERILTLLRKRATEMGGLECLGIDDQNNKGRTALIISAIRGRLAITEKLLKMGAQTHFKTIKDKNALDQASKRGHIAMVDLLKSNFNSDEQLCALQHAEKAYKKIHPNPDRVDPKITPIHAQIIGILCTELGKDYDQYMDSVKKSQGTNPESISFQNQTLIEGTPPQLIERRTKGILRTDKTQDQKDGETNLSNQSRVATETPKSKKIHWNHETYYSEPIREYKDESDEEKKFNG